jgi:hypothetical protein
MSPPTKRTAPGEGAALQTTATGGNAKRSLVALPRKMSTPLAEAVGRCVQTLADHASIPAIIALLLAAGGPRQCFNANGLPKVRHKSRKAAERHKASLMRWTGQSSRSLDVYECKICCFWHVGHRGGRRRRGGRP